MLCFVGCCFQGLFKSVCRIIELILSHVFCMQYVDVILSLRQNLQFDYILLLKVFSSETKLIFSLSSRLRPWSIPTASLHKGKIPLASFPNIKLNNLMVKLQWCWNLGKCGVALQWHCSQVYRASSRSI